MSNSTVASATSPYAAAILLLCTVFQPKILSEVAAIQHLVKGNQSSMWSNWGRAVARAPAPALQPRRAFSSELQRRRPIRQARALADGERVAIGGWVKSVRRHKSVTFVNVNDGSCLAELQLTLPGEEQLAAGAGTDSLAVDLADLTVGASVLAEGVLREVPGKTRRLELHPETLRVLGTCDARDYPLQKKYHSLEFLRENLHLRARTNTFGAVTRVRNALRWAALAPPTRCRGVALLNDRDLLQPGPARALPGERLCAAPQPDPDVQRLRRRWRDVPDRQAW